MHTAEGEAHADAGGPEEKAHIEFKIDGMVVSVMADREREFGPASLSRAKEAIARLARAQARVNGISGKAAARRQVSAFEAWAYRTD